ncbi:T9SS type A sorting domain-containing protein [Fulvivirga sp. M361]|uniref:putative Ig domain-containing protein n=1 Tax=Fulvivirga sp. M361 TaxID=2594266 RepID=UPI00117A788A|nr:putative Ig domain-containing protein [Fulvivirga sp. M361]TRX48571.1 T9SS type A sorting domain-containing protein [Fulvivirga sp. M361]
MKYFLWIGLWIYPLLCWSQEDYIIATAPFSYKSLTSANAINLTRGDVKGPIPIGFTFNFYGENYTEVYIGSAGFITFLPYQKDGCCEGQTIPNPSSPNGLIAGYWEDYVPERGGSISYQTLGNAPNRIFVVQYADIKHNYGQNPEVSFQIQLFEGANTIEIHCLDCTSDGDEHTQGIESQSGNEAAVRDGRSAADFSVVNGADIFARFNVQSNSNEITLSWPGFPQATGYTLQRFDGGTPVDIATLSASETSFTDSQLSPDTNYDYRLQVSLPGEELIEFNFTASTISSLPGDFRGVVSSPIEVQLSWTDNSSSEDGYIIERSLTSGTGFVEIARVGANEDEYDDRSLTSETTYFYRISAYNSTNTSEFTAEVMITTPGRSRYFVDADAEGGNDGSSWENAFANLYDVLAIAEDGAEVWVAEGIYKPEPKPRSRSARFDISQAGLSIYGGFAGDESSISARNIQAHPTILSGDIGEIGTTSDNVYQLISNTSEDNSLHLNGLTIRDVRGGGARSGGGMYSRGHIRLHNVIFENNQASTGGALYVNSGVELINCTFKNNSTTNTYGRGDGGGAVYLRMQPDENEDIYIKDSRFIDNDSDYYGGALYIDVKSNYTPKVSFNQVEIRGNTGGWHVGGLYIEGNCEVDITSSTISENLADRLGGGAWIRNDGSLSISNSTISGNTSRFSGAGLALNIGGNASLNHVTVFNNKITGNGDWEGGGILNYTPLTLKNCIVAGNKGVNSINDDISGNNDGQFISLGNNIIGDIGLQPFDANTIGDVYGDTEGTSEANEGAVRVTDAPVDPGLEDLAENGGFTLTHALKSDSRARNGGAPSDLSADQRGLPHVGLPDIGAFEFNAPPFLADGIPDQFAARLQDFSFTIPEGAFNTGDEGDVFTYTAVLTDDTDLPAWLTLDGTTGQFTGVPTEDDVTVVVKVTAQDRQDITITDEFEISVINGPAVDNIIPDQVAFQLQEFSFIVPANSFSPGNEGDVITYSATLSDNAPLPAWLTFDADTRQFSGTPTLTDISAIVIKVVATDQRGFFISDEFEISINIITRVDEVNNTQLHLYPNPVTDVLHVYLPGEVSEEVQVKVSTLNGLLLLHHTLTNQTGELTLSTSSLKPGIYVVELSSKTNIYQNKIIKE